MLYSTCLFTSILLHSVIAPSFMEQSGMGRCCSHLTIKSIVHLSDGIHNKWMYYRWLWPSIAILIHGQMTQTTLTSPKAAFLLTTSSERKKSNEKCFCSEKHYLCSCCSSSVASPSHLATSLLEAECDCNSLLMYIRKWEWGTAFLSVFFFIVWLARWKSVFWEGIFSLIITYY